MAQATIPVAVTGASGKMAQEALNAIGRDPELRLVGASSRRIDGPRQTLPGAGDAPVFRDVGSLLEKVRARVLVDFTVAEAAMEHARTAFRHRVSPVIGTTGLSQDNLRELEDLSLSTGLGVVVAPNFALGAVLMVHLASIASRYFEYSEIVELHHEGKVDAPSGTALATARAMAKALGRPFQWKAPQRETLPGTRGGQIEGVGIHSIRLPGLVAHQEVIFGTTGQTLSIRHDSISRESFMPGLLLAIKEVVKRDHLVLGLGKLLGLE
ncbi:MAG TPA: 4-hydroxy-tetrahydrodipicolinate reductase [Dehalococcoidia bacterium]|nr:4-hydroxy-tetrahydrodipicolinate reductase [Dehalococcoidia bacterium]